MQQNSGQLTPRYQHQGQTPLQYGSLPVGLAPSDAVIQSIRLRRAGSEWLCDNAKSFLRKVESRKSHRRKVQVQDGGLVITARENQDNIDQDDVKLKCILPMDSSEHFQFDVDYPESPLTDTPPTYCFDNTHEHHTHHDNVKININDLSDNWQHQFKIKPRTRPLASLSCGQLHMLRKLANIKLKTILEEYCPTHRTGWNWELPKLKKKLKQSDFKDKKAFGVPLSILQQRNGKALPNGITAAISYLRDNAMEQIGLFRKSGVKSRIQKLKTIIENMSTHVDFSDQQAFDVADMIKQYFRELPEVLLTNKLSETLILIFQYVPLECRTEAVQWVLLLLPDENSEALQVLLDLLHDVSLYSHINQMTPSNLAVCLVPTLFHFRNTGGNTGTPSQQELEDNRAAHECLLHFIVHNTELFTITVDLVVQCHFNYLEDAVPVTLSNLGSNLNQDWKEYQELCMAALLKVAKEKSLGWVSIYNPYRPHIDISYKKVGDEHPLELWRVCTEVEAPPSEVLQRILTERTLWDETCISAHVVKRLDAETDVYQYVLDSEGIKPLFHRDFCVIRSWKTQLQKSACMIVETSVEHPDAPLSTGAVRGLILASRYLIEPCGSGKSRILYLARMDIKGKTLEWYKYFGHLCAIHINRLCQSFLHPSTIGPESKV
ncbi:stAR-related lipid transfer protein 13 [Chrysoperla carnea]|uniref:stAR-related lipid transfer protein 13 n=1 Tax=Chrysoperla carnea TaxID=189513 RepID=UPI001D06B4CE|nr:stAR-related lipid transfer protein 13 [Chrysoperla carnea]